jgi:hypothetical protein
MKTDFARRGLRRGTVPKWIFGENAAWPPHQLFSNLVIPGQHERYRQNGGCERKHQYNNDGVHPFHTVHPVQFWK